MGFFAKQFFEIKASQEVQVDKVAGSLACSGVSK